MPVSDGTGGSGGAGVDKHASEPTPVVMEKDNFIASGPITVENQVDVTSQRDGIVVAILVGHQLGRTQRTTCSRDSIIGNLRPTATQRNRKRKASRPT